MIQNKIGSFGKDHPKDPVDVFGICPVCENPNLNTIGVDVFCHDCSWDSMQWHADALADAGIIIPMPRKMLESFQRCQIETWSESLTQLDSPMLSRSVHFSARDRNTVIGT